MAHGVRESWRVCVDSTLGANNDITVGPVTFLDSVTLADGNVGLLLAGLVTLGRIGGMNLSGYDTMRFTNGVLLQHGPAVINSNNSALTFESAGSISGPFGLTLNAGTAMLTGLDRLGTKCLARVGHGCSPRTESSVSIAQ